MDARQSSPVPAERVAAAPSLSIWPRKAQEWLSATPIRPEEETLRLIEAAGGRAAFRAADVRQEAQIRDLVSFAVDQFGSLGVLVDNATAPFSHGYEMNNWLETAETDSIGPLIAARYALAAMCQSGRGGAIVNVTFRRFGTAAGLPRVRRL